MCLLVGTFCFFLSNLVLLVVVASGKQAASLFSQGPQGDTHSCVCVCVAAPSRSHAPSLELRVTRRLDAVVPVFTCAQQAVPHQGSHSKLKLSVEHMACFTPAPSLDRSATLFFPPRAAPLLAAAVPLLRQSLVVWALTTRTRTTSQPPGCESLNSFFSHTSERASGLHDLDSPLPIRPFSCTQCSGGQHQQQEQHARLRSARERVGKKAAAVLGSAQLRCLTGLNACAKEAGRGRKARHLVRTCCTFSSSLSA